MFPIDQAFVDLIGAVYDAVLNPNGWYGALDRIRAHFGLHNAVLGLNRFVHEPVAVAVSVNIPPEFLAKLGPEYSDEIVRMWGGRKVMERFPIEEPVALLSLIDEQRLLENKYYRDFGEPQGLIDQVAVVLTRDRRQVGNVGFGRHRDMGPVTDDVVAGLRILAPHLRRAALITGILEEERKQSTLFEAVVDAIRSGIVLVDGNARIIHANPAARAAMDRGDPLRNAGGKLELRGEIVSGQLEVAIHTAADGDIPLGRRGIVIPGVRTDGTPFVAHVMPLRDRTSRAGLPTRTVAAVFLADRDDEPKIIVDAATLIYSLTPTEARVFELVVEGRTTAEIARALAIAPSTLKWHTLQLYEKTGHHRRADLVRLAAQLRPG